MEEKKILFQIDRCDGTNGKSEKLDVANRLSATTESLWRKTESRDHVNTREPEELPQRVQVLVIGGGMAGVLTAYQLKQRGIEAVVVERGEVGRTCTANTTAKITSLQGAIYQKIENAYGAEKALQYYQSQQKSIEQYEEIISACHIDCDFERKSHIMYAVEDVSKLEQEYKCMQQLGIKAQWIQKSPLPFSIDGGIMFQHQAQFHPLKFVDQLTQHINVFEHCQATRIDSDGTVEINHQYEIKAEKIVIATHYPIINSKGFYFTRLDQERSYVIGLKQKNDFDIHDMYIDIKESGHTFRPYQDTLIMGVGNHRSGKKKVDNYYKQLEAEAMKWFPEARIEYHWSNQDCMSLDHIPYIGQYSTALSNIYVASGFNQWGMSNSMVAANVIADMIEKGDSEYAELYSPRRHQLSGTGTFLVNGALSVYHLTRQLLHVKEKELKEIQKDDAGIVKLDGQVVGVYRDENDELHVVDTKCPHLGCQLKWNAREKTWDCPCHGSRFDIDGHLIEDPAQRDLNTACHLKKTEE